MVRRVSSESQRRGPLKHVVVELDLVRLVREKLAFTKKRAIVTEALKHGGVPPCRRDIDLDIRTWLKLAGMKAK